MMKKFYVIATILFALMCTPMIFAQPTFTVKTDFTTGNVPHTVSIGDFNGDGNQDLVVANEYSNSVSLLLNTTSLGAVIPTFAPKLDFPTGNGPRSVSVGDMNMDGKADLAVTNFTSNTLSIFLNTTLPGTSILSFQTRSDFITGSGPNTVAIGDVNGDGKPDLAVSNEYSGSISIYMNNTVSGSLTLAVNSKIDFPCGIGLNGVTVGDFNGDGKPDLAAITIINEAKVLVNNTTQGTMSPSFTAGTNFTVGTTPHSISIGDFNGDGKSDLAVANTNSHTVSILLNTTVFGSANPSFAIKSDFSTGFGPFTVSVGDVNGDGKQDLAVTNITSNTVSVLLNTTASGSVIPSFTAKTDFSTGNAPRIVTIGDLNGDGKPDLAVSNSNSRSVSVFLNTTVSGKTDACITWDLLSTNSVTSVSGNINGQMESIGAGSSPPLMSVYGYSNGQQLWVGNTGWVAGPLDPQRYVEFNALPQTGNSFTVTNVSFNYGDFPLDTNFSIVNFQAYYSTDNWVNSIVLNPGALVYLNTTMSFFSRSLNVQVPSNKTFSLRIYPYALQHGIAMTPTFAIHNNVTICGTTEPEILETGSICGTKFNDLNGNGMRDKDEPGLPEWQILIGGTVDLSVLTDKNGEYCFSNLKEGEYKIGEELRSGWHQTAPRSPNTYTVSLRRGENIENLDFGNQIITNVVCIDPPSGMVAWWPLDENADTTSLDLAGSNNIGTHMNGPLPVTAKVSTGLQFDGINDYVEAQDHAELNFGTGDFSFDAWIRTTDSVGAHDLVDKRASSTNILGYSFFLNNGKLSLQLCDGSFTSYSSSVFVADGEWHHIAVTVSRASQTGITFYRDGVASQFGDPTNHQGSINNKSPLRIGSQSFSVNYLFRGSLDEIELFDRVIANDEVNALFKAGSAGKCKPSDPLGSLCGTKFNDANGNGIREKNERGIPNWQISLNVSGIPAVMTDSLGNYCFVDVKSGTYTVSEVMQSGWQQTVPSPPGTYTVTLAAGQHIDSLNFGNKLNPCGSEIKAWSPVGIGLNRNVNALAVIGTDLYAGGEMFLFPGGVANRIAKWNGTNWSAFGNGGISSYVHSLAVIGTDLYAGGIFSTAGGVSLYHNIVKWDGTNWGMLGSGTNSYVRALAVIGTDLYAGGHFVIAGGISANRIAKWNGTTWSSMDIGVNSYVRALAVMGTDLYVGGLFTLAGGAGASRIAKWNGTTWSSLGTGMNGEVHALVVNGTDVYAGGSFTSAGGVSANGIAKWNGTSWSALGSGINGTVDALAVIGSDLYAGGVFTSAGGVSANRIAKWDGANWTMLGSGMNNYVRAFAVIGADLYAGGGFTTAGGTNVQLVAKFSCTMPTVVDKKKLENTIPEHFLLEQNFPNPFNPTSTIRYDIPRISFVKISVYDILGREIRVLVNEEKSPGSYEMIFDAIGLPSGIYFYVIRTGDFIQSKKMILMK